MKKLADRMRQRPERRILNAFTVDDISTIVKDESALVVVNYFIANTENLNLNFSLAGKVYR
jgi:hypothetical protein